MAQPYVGEIKMFAGNFAPAGWMFCQGQLLPISEQETLFALIGTTYGGDGESTFALPDLRGRLPIHMGQGGGLDNRVLGETGGSEEVTLMTNQIPAHTHSFVAISDVGNQTSPVGNLAAQSLNVVPFINDAPSASFNAGAISPAGGSQAHTNFQPYLCVNFIISLFGIFPSPS
jgi:microcystin-dependent protein